MFRYKQQIVGNIRIYSIFINMTQKIAVDTHFFGVSSHVLYPKITDLALKNGQTVFIFSQFYCNVIMSYGTYLCGRIIFTKPFVKSLDFFGALRTEIISRKTPGNNGVADFKRISVVPLINYCNLAFAVFPPEYLGQLLWWQLNSVCSDM